MPPNEDDTGVNMVHEARRMCGERERRSRLGDVDEGSTSEEREALEFYSRAAPSAPCPTRLARVGRLSEAASITGTVARPQPRHSTSLTRLQSASSAVESVHRAAGTLNGGTACAAHSSLASSP